MIYISQSSILTMSIERVGQESVHLDLFQKPKNIVE